MEIANIFDKNVSIVPHERCPSPRRHLTANGNIAADHKLLQPPCQTPQP